MKKKDILQVLEKLENLKDVQRETGQWCKRIIEILAVIALVILVLSVFCMIHERFFRLDQHATTIFGTTAGVVGSMFGLTAASYAFIWGDLRSDRQSNRHLEKVLGQYREDLWRLFNRALQLTTVVIFSSLTGLAFAQKVTDPSLFKVVQRANIMLSFYYNKNRNIYHSLPGLIWLYHLLPSTLCLL